MESTNKKKFKKFSIKLKKIMNIELIWREGCLACEENQKRLKGLNKKIDKLLIDEMD